MSEFLIPEFGSTSNQTTRWPMAQLLFQRRFCSCVSPPHTLLLDLSRCICQDLFTCISHLLDCQQLDRCQYWAIHLCLPRAQHAPVYSAHLHSEGWPWGVLDRARWHHPNLPSLLLHATWLSKLSDRHRGPLNVCWTNESRISACLWARSKDTLLGEICSIHPCPQPSKANDRAQNVSNQRGSESSHQSRQWRAALPSSPGVSGVEGNTSLSHLLAVLTFDTYRWGTY